MVTCKPSLRHIAETVTMHAHNHNIEQKQITKILGATISNKLNHQEHINTVISTVNYRIHCLRHIAPYTVFKTRLHIANATIISTFMHLLPLLINATKAQLAKLQTLQLKSARLTIGSPCFKWSTARMLRTCNWHSIYSMITEQSTTLIHKIVTDKQPLSLYNMLTSTMHCTGGRRTARKLHMSHRAITDRLNDSLMYKAISLYNALPSHLIALSTVQFKPAIKKHVISTYSPDSIPVRIT